MPDVLKEYELLIERADRELESQKRQKHDLTKSLDELADQSSVQKGQISKQFRLFHEALQLKER